MRVTFDKTVIDGVFRVTVSTGYFTLEEQRAMQFFGEPVVDTGGLFYGDAFASTPNAATPIGSSPIVLHEINEFAPSSTPTSAPIYMHSSRLKKIQSDFGNAKSPFQMIFNGRTLGVEQAEEDALLWIATMEIRFNNIIYRLRQVTNDFTGMKMDTF